MKHKSQNLTDEKNKVVQKKRQNDAGKKGKDQSVLQGDMTTLQQGLGNQAVVQMMQSEEQEKAGVKAQEADSFSSIMARPASGQPAPIQRGPQRIEVAPAHPDLGHAAESASAGPMNAAHPNLLNQMDLETAKTMSPALASSEKSAGYWNKAADAIGIGAPIIAGIITLATGGVGAPAAEVVGIVARGLTILCKEMEKKHLIGEINALARMLPYVPPENSDQYLVWKTRIEEYAGKYDRAEIKQLKNLFAPPLVVGMAEFAGSLAYKKRLESATNAAAQKLDKGPMLEWVRDRERSKNHEKGLFDNLDDIQDRQRPMSNDHDPSKWQKLKSKLPGQRNKVSRF